MVGLAGKEEAQGGVDLDLKTIQKRLRFKRKHKRESTGLREVKWLARSKSIQDTSTSLMSTIFSYFELLEITPHTHHTHHTHSCRHHALRRGQPLHSCPRPHARPTEVQKLPMQKRLRAVPPWHLLCGGTARDQRDAPYLPHLCDLPRE